MYQNAIVTPRIRVVTLENDYFFESFSKFFRFLFVKDYETNRKKKIR